MPLVTIIIPIYNAEKYLKKCLKSVVNQTYQNLEIILINDLSTDYSKHIAEQYVKNYKNIKLINNKINLGIGESRNIGLDIANGEYIYFLDSDDWIDKTAIQRLVNIALNYQAKLVECSYTMVLGKISIQKGKKEKNITIKNFQKNPKLLYNNQGYAWSKLYQTNLFEDLRFPKKIMFEDFAFTGALLTKVRECIKTSEKLYFYRRHPSSITFSSKCAPNEKFLDILESGKILRENCKKLGTYQEYGNIIEEIIRYKNLIALMDSNTWFQMKLEDRMHLLNLMYQFLSQEQNMDNFESWDTVKEAMQTRKIYQLRMQYLKCQLQKAKQFNITSNTPLEDAKKIIRKYTREKDFES